MFSFLHSSRPDFPFLFGVHACLYSSQCHLSDIWEMCIKKSIGSVPSTFTFHSPKKGGKSPSNWLSLIFQVSLRWFSAFFPQPLLIGPSSSTPSSLAVSSSVPSSSSASLLLLLAFATPSFPGSHSSSLPLASSSLDSGGICSTIL